MELTFAWFWLIKLVIAGIGGFFAWKLFQSEFKSKLWWVATVAMVLFIVVSPLKLDVDTRSQTHYTNETIRKGKVIPPKIEDNSFEQNTNKNIGISENDLKQKRKLR